MRGEVQSYLELAVDYGDCGLWDEAIEVLERAAGSGIRKMREYPLVHYYLGHYCGRSGRAERLRMQLLEFLAKGFQEGQIQQIPLPVARPLACDDVAQVRDPEDVQRMASCLGRGEAFNSVGSEDHVHIEGSGLDLHEILSSSDFLRK